MAVCKPSIPKGTRDFSPIEMARRNYIFDTIKSVFRLYGFSQIETPAMENLSTLMGKYGDEGDKLLFKILNSGDFLAGVDKSELESANSVKVLKHISDKGLRYDLTVPFARYVVMNRGNLSFPFKRFQIHPVWRADKPQKGRYREFYQCDVDVLGSDSLLNEVDITVAIDKLDKIGVENVNAELREKGVSEAGIEKLQPIINMTGSNDDKLNVIADVLKSSEIGLKGVEELRTILRYVKMLNVATEVEIDLTLARGLNYYTGAIFEVKAKDVVIGSITGGGRYDNLTGVFGLDGMSGVGISFGADRIYDVLNQLDLYPQELLASTQILFATFGENEFNFALNLLKEVRNNGISAEIYPEPVKMKKQMSYADNKAMPYVAIVGETEMAENKVMLKNMVTGEQQLVGIAEVVSILKK